jgi:FkbM family methyltransferase
MNENRFRLLAALVTVLVLLLFGKNKTPQAAPSGSNEVKKETDRDSSRTRPRTRTSTSTPAAALGNGCYHVFIDAGSNRGVHGRFLFEPEKYNASKFVHKFTEIYGDHRTLQNICVFAFEPNPYHNKSQRETQAAYGRMGWRYHYLPVGVSNANGKLTFYRNYDVKDGGLSEEWGFGTLLSGAPNKDQEVLVDIVDFSEWLERHVLDREVPPKNSYNLGPPVVAIKMDIEGSEFATLDHMVDTGTAYKVNVILGEWHPWVPQQIRGVKYTTRQDLQLLSSMIASRLGENNGPGFVEFDDEQYLHDGMEYPEPT